jgi:drug/metabolite transporter (DMT)-like permease
MKKAALSIELLTLLYFLSYVPNVLVTKLVTSQPHEGLGRPLTGLETLPSSLIFSAVATFMFVWLRGWHRDAHQVKIGTRHFPCPTKATFLSGIGTALILFTVPLSFTFVGVSIPFIQLVMRGDILIIAPLVDLIFGRRVRWWSWVALVMVAFGLFLTISQRGGLNLPPLALITVILYTLGYFIRLVVMNKVSKSGDDVTIRRYFVEEKIVALPLSVIALAALSLLGLGSQGGELARGFVAVWTDNVIWPLLFIGATLFVISIFSIMILLDARENSFCVPFERSASLLAGIVVAFIMHWGWGLPAPTGMELIGAALLVAAIVLLSVAPRYDTVVRRAISENQ